MLLGLALFGAAASAQADTRVATVPYVADAVVTLHGRIGFSSTIQFDDDERIENIAVGDSAVWQVTPNRRANLLFVKPVVARARSNMTVVTDRHTYMFDLVSASGPKSARVLYMLRFRYPPRPAPVAVAAPAAAPAAPAAEEAAPGAAVAALNFAWRGSGDKALLPARSFDDGRSVYLEWPRDVTLPAILVRESKDAEGPVNFTVQGAFVVVEGVPAQLVLRSGKRSAILTRDTTAPSSPQTASTAR